MRFTFFNKSGQRGRAYGIDPAAGTMVIYAASGAPSGWLSCNGQEVSRTTYAALDAVIGTTYGAYTNGSGGAGTTHFKLPDLGGRVAIGSGTGTGLTARTLGATGGVESVTLTAAQSAVAAHSHATTETAHTHTVSNDQHRHGIGYNNDARYSINDFSSAHLVAYGTAGAQTFYPDDPTGGKSASVSVASGFASMTLGVHAGASASSAHNNIAPTVVLNYIIKY